MRLEILEDSVVKILECTSCSAGENWDSNVDFELEVEKGLALFIGHRKSYKMRYQVGRQYREKDELVDSKILSKCFGRRAINELGSSGLLGYRT